MNGAVLRDNKKITHSQMVLLEIDVAFMNRIRAYNIKGTSKCVTTVISDTSPE
jgi:hypothetical protein